LCYSEKQYKSHYIKSETALIFLLQNLKRYPSKDHRFYMCFYALNGSEVNFVKIVHDHTFLRVLLDIQILKFTFIDFYFSTILSLPVLLYLAPCYNIYKGVLLGAENLRLWYKLGQVISESGKVQVIQACEVSSITA
jgi:hypothetical protein